MTLAVKLDGEKYKGEGFPSKEGHIFKGYDCGDNKEVNLVWDKITWSASLSNIKTKTTCILEFETADNLNLNGSEPVVKEGLVPVVIENNGTVTKTETDDINWYDYNESKWANAVILTGTDIYQVGDRIPEEAIESYFVWIPKYRYKLFNVEGNQIDPMEIEIEIGDYDTVDNDTTECIAQNKSGDNGTCKNDMWMTHPAFTSLGVNGIWVGKFGASGLIEENLVKIKPNVNSFMNIVFKGAYYTSFNYKRNLDSHMMKNTEWGAVAYLTNSKYGLYKDIVTDKQVYQNNHMDSRDASNKKHYTGCGANEITDEMSFNCLNAFGTKNNGIYKQSTTWNITGIFDVSGGRPTWVMGNLKNLPAESELEPSDISEKYKNIYNGESNNYKILGDATEETKNWNGDISNMLTEKEPFMQRGWYEGGKNLSGIFAYATDGGSKWGSAGTFKIVLSPTN